MNHNKTMRIRKVTAPPMKSLESCITYAKSLYEIYSHNKFTKTEIASTLNFTASSGGFQFVFYGLRSFGLIEQERDGYKVSELFKKIRVADKNSNEFKRLCFEAIKLVPLYTDLLNEYRIKLPPSKIISDRLEIDKKIIPNTAKTIAENFEKSLQYAGVLDMNGNILPVRDDRTPGKNDNASFIKTEDKEDIPENVRDINEKDSVSMLSLEIPLPNNRKVKILYPQDIVVDEAKKIANVLNALAI
jgi:hypothetical protein